MKTVTGMGGMGNARELAEMLRQLGRGRDTVLAHITPEEAQMLLDRGGSGTTNPQTGLPEFQEDYADPQYDFYGEAPAQDQTYDPFAGMPAETPTGPMFEPPADLGGMVDQQQAADFYGAPGMGYGEVTSPEVRQDISAYFGAQPETPAEPGFAQRIESQLGGMSQIAQKYPRLAQLAGYSTQGLIGMLQAARARRQGQQEAARFSELGRPLRESAEALRTQALAGQLTPQQAAQQETSRARLRQAAAGRGTTTGTQATMIENQLARSRSELSQTNLNNALRQLNLANAYDEAAIRARMAADREADDLLAQIFGNIGSQVAGATPVNRPQRPATQTSAEITRRPELPRGE